jgi:hypothetical protein
MVARMRLTLHVWFSALGSEIMAAWLHQKLDQAGGGELLNSGSDYWHDSTKAN